jgi:hypothetical protein
LANKAPHSAEQARICGERTTERTRG